MFPYYRKVGIIPSFIVWTLIVLPAIFSKDIANFMLGSPDEINYSNLPINPDQMGTIIFMICSIFSLLWIIKVSLDGVKGGFSLMGSPPSEELDVQAVVKAMLGEPKTNKSAISTASADHNAKLKKDLRKSLKKFENINKAYLETEIDPETIILRPLILDVSYSYTEDFHTNLEKADILYSKLSSITNKNNYSVEDERKISEFGKDVDTLDKSWRDLWAKASEAGIPGISMEKKRQAKSLLNMILDPSVSSHERSLSRDKLNSILDTYLGHSPLWKSSIDKAINREISHRNFLTLEK